MDTSLEAFSYVIVSVKRGRMSVCTCYVGISNSPEDLRWEFRKENKKERKKKENTLSTKKAAKETIKTVIVFFFIAFLGRKHVFLFSLIKSHLRMRKLAF